MFNNVSTNTRKDGFSLLAGEGRIATSEEVIDFIYDGIFNGQSEINIKDYLEIGNIYNIGNTTGKVTYQSSTTRVRTKEGFKLHLKVGDCIKLTSYENAEFYVGRYNPDGTYNSYNWRQQDLNIIDGREGEFIILVHNIVEEDVSMDGLGDMVRIVRKNLDSRFSNIQNSIDAEQARAVAAESLLDNTKVDKVSGKGLVNTEIEECLDVVSNPDYLSLEIDANDNIISGRKIDGTKFETMNIEIPAATIESIVSPEWMNVVVDENGKIIQGIRADGTIYSSSSNETKLPFESIKYKFCVGKIQDVGTIGSTVVDITNILPNTVESVGMYLIDECVEGDEYLVNVIGGDSWRAVSFVDKNYVLLWQTPANFSAINEVVSAPADGYIIVNGLYNGYKYDVQKRGAVKTKVSFPDPAWSIPDVYMPTEGSWHSMNDSQSEFKENMTVAQVYALYDALMQSYPNYITKNDLGMDTSNTFHIYNYVFTPSPIPMIDGSFDAALPPRFLIVGGIHGAGPKGDADTMKGVLYNFLKDLCENWSTNPALEAIRWNMILDVVPIINPYGHENHLRGNVNGVDINRNAFRKWSKIPALSDGEPNPQYSGEFPMSEAESMAWFNWVNSHRDASFFVDIHTTGLTDTTPTPVQLYLMYGGCLPNADFFYIHQSVVRKVSNIWNHLNIPGLQTDILHGMSTISAQGANKMAPAVLAMGIESGLFEGFPTFRNMQVEANGSEIMHMLQVYLGNQFLHIMRYIYNK